MKNDSSSTHSGTARTQREVAGLLDVEARQFSKPEYDERFTQRIMQRVVGTQRVQDKRKIADRSAVVSPFWLGTAATAAAVVLTVLVLPYWSSPAEQFRFQLPPPNRLDQPLAASEHAMSTELEDIGADLHQLARLASIRLESDSS